MEAGVFDNLPNRGKPISLDLNPYEDSSLWMAHHLLHVNGFAPAWIEEARDIDQAAAQLRLLLRDRSSRAAGEFSERAAQLNRRILTYNLKCPNTQFHKALFNIADELKTAQKTALEV